MTTHPIIDTTQGQLAVARWRLDPAASSAEFQVPQRCLVTVNGHLERLDGWLEIDESEQRRITLTIAGKRVPLKLDLRSPKPTTSWTSRRRRPSTSACLARRGAHSE